MAYIDREKALLELQKFSFDTSNQYGVGYSDCLMAVEDVLNDLPTADVVEVKHAKWIYDEEEDCYICSKCKLSALNNYRGLSVSSNYCSHCGAKMDSTPQKEG